MSLVLLKSVSWKEKSVYFPVFCFSLSPFLRIIWFSRYFYLLKWFRFIVEIEDTHGSGIFTSTNSRKCQVTIPALWLARYWVYKIKEHAHNLNFDKLTNLGMFKKVLSHYEISWSDSPLSPLMVWFTILSTQEKNTKNYIYKKWAKFK